MRRLLVLPLLLALTSACGGRHASAPASATTSTPAATFTTPASPTAAISPSPSPAIQPWTWLAPNIGDWIWVRVFGDTLFASSGPQFRGNSDCFNGPGPVTALDARTGSERWHFDTHSQPFPVTVAAGRAFFGTAAGAVFALDAATGTVASQLDSGAASAPSIPLRAPSAGKRMCAISRSSSPRLATTSSRCPTASVVTMMPCTWTLPGD